MAKKSPVLAFAKELPQNIFAGFVVSLIALPLGLGLAIASDAPPLSGIIAAVAGGIVVALFGGSHVTIAGPGNGLVIVLLAAITTLGEGNLYEGIGQYGSSKLSQVDLKTGKVNEKLSITLAGDYFGEGITVFNDKIYQLTWEEQTCFVYNKSTFELDKTIPYIGEGWGLCNDGKYLIMSNGSERITFRNPETFAIEKIIEVYDNKGPIQQLNELEYIDGKIYANVYTSNQIVVIDPITGRVEAIIDCSILEKEGRGYGDVLNGIAYNDEKIYMTGKNWNKLFEVNLEKP